MKKLLVALAATVAVLGLAVPAQAIHKGTICKVFKGPDGDVKGAHLSACISVDDHDFEDQIRAILVATNGGNESVTLHVSYLKLIRYSTDIRTTGSFVYTLPAGFGAAHAFATTWVNSPSGEYHSRIRMWVCWPERAGDPCGSIVTWNSGDAIYQ